MSSYSTPAGSLATGFQVSPPSVVRRIGAKLNPP
jgi:hypothetical protein